VFVCFLLEEGIVCGFSVKMDNDDTCRGDVPVTPTMIFLLAIQAPRERRILWPAWRWSKVPPSATTSNNGGGVGRFERDSLGLNGDGGCSGRYVELLGSIFGRKDWRMADMDDGRGVAIVSRKGYLIQENRETWTNRLRRERRGRRVCLGLLGCCGRCLEVGRRCP
jgi:hypothetical protein